MSQILAPRTNSERVLLFQDLYFARKKILLESTIREVLCTICDKGLDDGVSVTAKTVNRKTRLFCQYHYPKDY